jgi:cytochrome P450
MHPALPVPAPGPRGYPLLGVMPSLARNPLQFLDTMVRQYGDIVRLPLGPREMYIIAHPDLAKAVLQDQHADFVKGPIFRLFSPLIGQGLVASEGDFWRQQRRLIQPAFHRQRLASLAEAMTDEVSKLLDTWTTRAATRTSFDIAEEMTQLTQQIIIRTMFSTAVGAQDAGRAISIVFHYFSKRLWTFFLPSWVPLPGRGAFERALERLNRTVYQIIETRRQASTAQPDLLTMLLEARAEDGSGMSDQQIRDEVMNIFVAGHETTAHALTWVWYALSQHPDVAARLEAEVAQVVGTRVPTIEDLSRLTYTRMVIEETMRLYPPAWMIPRATISPVTLGAYQLPAHAAVLVCPYFTHRHPDFWEQPETFDPERFAPHRERERVRYAYFPFGGGPRQCIGSHFAMMEAQFIVAMVVQRYCVNLVANHTVIPQADSTLRPRHGVHVSILPAHNVSLQGV